MAPPHELLGSTRNDDSVVWVETPIPRPQLVVLVHTYSVPKMQFVLDFDLNLCKHTKLVLIISLRTSLSQCAIILSYLTIQLCLYTVERLLGSHDYDLPRYD